MKKNIPSQIITRARGLTRSARMRHNPHGIRTGNNRAAIRAQVLWESQISHHFQLYDSWFTLRHVTSVSAVHVSPNPRPRSRLPLKHTGPAATGSYLPYIAHPSREIIRNRWPQDPPLRPVSLMSVAFAYVLLSACVKIRQVLTNKIKFRYSPQC